MLSEKVFVTPVPTRAVACCSSVRAIALTRTYPTQSPPLSGAAGDSVVSTSTFCHILRAFADSESVAQQRLPHVMLSAPRAATVAARDLDAATCWADAAAVMRFTASSVVHNALAMKR